MKSKKLLVFLIMFVFIAVLVVLNSTLFTLQKINVTWMTSTFNLKNVTDVTFSSIVEEKGDSIFLLDKKKIASDLEKKYPYLRIVGIETKFPNKINIYSAEREDLYAIKLADDNYAIVDDYGKVLSKTRVLAPNVSGMQIDPRPIEVLFDSIQLNDSDFMIGEQVKVEFIENVLTRLSNTLKEANYTTLAKKGIFESIKINSMGNNGELEMLLTTRNGMVIDLINAEDKMTDKFMLGLQVYNKYHQDSYSEGTIVVQYSSAQKKVIAYYNDKVVV